MKERIIRMLGKLLRVYVISALTTIVYWIVAGFDHLEYLMYYLILPLIIFAPIHLCAILLYRISHISKKILDSTPRIIFVNCACSFLSVEIPSLLFDYGIKDYSHREDLGYLLAIITTGIFLFLIERGLKIWRRLRTRFSAQ